MKKEKKLSSNITTSTKKPVSKKTMILALTLYSVCCLVLGFVVGILLGMIIQYGYYNYYF